VAADKRVIAKLYERDIDLLILEELQCSEEFRRWLATRVFGAAVYAKFGSVEYSVSDTTGRESDLIYLFHSADEDGLLAILIENKIDAVAQPNQAEDYLKRGQSGEGDKWNQFRTCLVAPNSYLDDAPNASLYQANVSYEELLAYFASRQDRDERFRWKVRLIEHAIVKKAEGYQAVISAAATEFAREYYALAVSMHSDLGLRPPKPRPAGNTWMAFRPSWLPKDVVIEHQVTAGAVKLLIYGAAERVDDLRRDLDFYLRDDMHIAAAGKSAAIVLKVPEVESVEIPFEIARERMKSAIEGVAAVQSVARGILKARRTFL